MNKSFHKTIQVVFCICLGCFCVGLVGGCKPQGDSNLTLSPLAFETDALTPYLSQKTLVFHHGKHLKGYIEKTLALLDGTEYEGLPLTALIQKTVNNAEQKKLFNNAAQVFNHQFYFNCLTPKGGGKPSGKVADAINQAFGSYEKFAAALTSQALDLFGSGWVWVVQSEKGLEIMATKDADTPIAHGVTPILALDVWEHAYYLDYQNRRAEYVKAFIAHLINWDFVSQSLGEVPAPAHEPAPTHELTPVHESAPAPSAHEEHVEAHH